MPSDLQVCVVCGAGSHRTDWLNKLNGFVACDNHSKADFVKAVQAAQAPKPVTPPAPPAGVPIPPKTN
jgi:hypothetical protein